MTAQIGNEIRERRNLSLWIGLKDLQLSQLRGRKKGKKKSQNEESDGINHENIWEEIQRKLCEAYRRDDATRTFWVRVGRNDCKPPGVLQQKEGENTQRGRNKITGSTRKR